MRYFLFVLALLIAVGCGSKKPATAALAINLQSECPTNSDCSIEVFQNKTLLVKQDEFGSLHYTIEDDSQKKVIRYTYSKKVKGNLQDAGYREEIIFELANFDPIKLGPSSLQNAKMLFGRFCFCRGQTGYYKVTEGTFEIENQIATLQFKVPEVPQITNEIRFSIP